MRRPLDGVVEIDIIGGPSLLDIPEFFMGAMHWASRVSVERPACLLCEHQWTSLKQESPAAFAFITPWQNVAPEAVNRWTVAICEKCARLPNLRERALTAFKQRWPNSVDLGVRRPTPGRRQ
jgi:hypothetical protein